MNSLQRIKNIVFGLLMLLYAVLMAILPADAYDTVAALITLMMLFYGGKMLYFYFTMARHMVGGKITLYQAIIILDLGMFTAVMSQTESYTIIAYLLVIYIFTGAIDILRAIEAKNNGAKSWKLKLISGIVIVLFAVVAAVLGVVWNNTDILVYGYCISLAYSAIIRIVTAFRKTSIVYIQ